MTNMQDMTIEQLTEYKANMIVELVKHWQQNSATYEYADCVMCRYAVSSGAARIAITLITWDEDKYRLNITLHRNYDIRVSNEIHNDGKPAEAIAAFLARQEIEYIKAIHSLIK